MQGAQTQVARTVTGDSKWIDLSLLTLAAAALMLYDLGAKPLAGDEATSYFIASLEWPDFWTSISTSEANASLFYTLLRIPVAFDSGHSMLRLIPALCGIATVPVLYLLLTRLFDRRTAVVGAAALTVNAFFVAHAQDVRGYSMAAFLAALATLLFVMCVENPTTRRLALYVVAGAAGCYAHFFSALVIGAHLLSLFLLPASLVAWRRLAGAHAAIAALCAPLAYFVLSNDRGQVDWILPTTGEIVLKNLYELAGHGGRWLFLAVAACVLLALVRLARTFLASGRSRATWVQGLVVLWLFLPLLFVAGITFVKPLFVARFLLPALPGLSAAVAVGLAWLTWRPAFVGASAVVLVLFALQLPDWYSVERPDWKKRADRVVENARPGDVTLFYAPTAIRPFGYYGGYYAERDDGKIAPPPIYPPVDWLGYSQTRFEPALDAILSEAARHERVWLVAAYAEAQERQAELAELRSAIDASCSQVPGFWGVVRLYTDCTSP